MTGQPVGCAHGGYRTVSEVGDVARGNSRKTGHAAGAGDLEFVFKIRLLAGECLADMRGGQVGYRAESAEGAQGRERLFSASLLAVDVKKCSRASAGSTPVSIHQRWRVR